MTKTEMAVAAIAAGIMIWDGFLAFNRRQGDTISEIMRSWAKTNPLVPFLWGALMGHWWW